MIRNVVYFFFFPAILLGLFLQSDGIPVSYDQRQDGKYNIDAKLENFVFVIATSGKNDLINTLANQAFEINLAAVPSRDETDEPQRATVYETDEKNDGREPYHVEIIRIEKEGEGDKKDTHSTLKFEDKEAVKKTDSKPSTDAENQKVSNDENVKKARSLWKFDDRHKLHEKENERLILIHLKKAGEMKYSEPQHEDFSVKEEILKAGKIGTSIKKQLSKTEHEHAFSLRQEKNNVGLNQNKPHELKLLGGGIENCGPGRYRDKLGICQFDKDFD